MGLSNCITKARDAIKKSAKKQRNQAMRSGAPDTSEQFAETQEKALVGLIARIGDVQALDGDNQAAADAIRSAIEDLMLDREALAIQVERAGLEMPAAPDVAVAEKADQPGAETVTAPAEAEASFTKRGDYWYHSGERAKAIAKAAGLVSTMRNGVPEVAIADHAREQIAGELKAAGIDVRFSTADAVSQPKTDAATEAKQDKAPADARLTSAQASDQMEWRNLGQRDGTKTQALFFYETAEDMAAHRGSMQYGEVTQYDGGKWQFDGVSYDSLGAAKKAAEQAAVVRLVKDGYVDSENSSPDNSGDQLDAAKIRAGYAHRSLGGLGDKVKMEQGWFDKASEEFAEKVWEKAESEEQQALAANLLADFKAEYKARRYRVMDVGASVVSSAVAGRNKFNSAQAGKRGNALDKAEQDFSTWQADAIASGIRAIRAARSQEQIAAEQQAKDDKAAKKKASLHALLGKLIDFKKGDNVRFGNYPVAKVSLDKAGYPSSVTVDATDLTDNKFDIARILFDGDKDKLRAAVDEIRAGLQTTDAAMSSAEVPDVSTVESHSEFTDRLNDGNVTIDEFKARFESVKKSKDALIAELGKKTKPELLAILGGYRADRMKNDKKDRIVDSVYTSMLDDFVLGNSISYSFGSKYEDVIGGYVARYGQADIDAYAERIKASRAEREQRAEQIAAAVKDPQDFAEYQVYIKAKLAEGMTLQQARMSLPAEKRAMFDNEMAEASRNARGERKEVAKTQVQAAAQTTAGQLFETKHTKTGEPLFVVKTADRVDRDIYNQWNATAKRLGGYYSSYRGNGAIPGFTFKTKEGAEAFMQYLGGDTVAAQDAIKTDRDAFADDRSQSAVERLNEMADRLDANADSVLSADRKTNTERRARFAASAEAAANSNKAMAQTMRNIAKSISEGTAKFLDMVRQKAQVEMLRSKLQTAKQDEAKAQDPNGWYTKELHKKPATVETADFATWPTYTAYRSDLAQMGRALLQLDGGKRLGQSVLKVADDVTNAYKAFAKENLYKVSTFKTSDGGPAVFSTADKAEEAIARSGFKGKATTISFKRGEHLVIMGPQMARENGIWQGDDDQRITLAPDFAEQIVAFNKSLNKRTQDIRMPWVFDNVAKERARWKAMGIETPAEMRAALREFVSLNEQAKEVDKIKQMERAMIGRRKDGLDFFPTAEATTDSMIDAADIEEGMTALEPEAGMGHIADRLRERGVEPDVAELSGDRRELLEAKGYNVVGNDFLSMTLVDTPDGNGYDRIIMNPPFSNRRDAEHVQHAYTLLRPDGRIVALMGEGVFFGQDKKAVEFREWLESVGGTSEKLPEGSFLDPSLPVNTSVNARMVVIDKQDTATAKTDSGIALLSPSLGRVDADKVDVATARAVVSGLLAGWRNAPNSSVVATASDLPVVVREELANQGEKTARGVYHGGTFYLVADEHSTEAEIEETVFHEVWSHYGLRSMFGAQTTTKLAAVFDAISASGFMGFPGKDAFRAFSRRHGFETAQTEAMLRKGETFDPRFTEAVKKRILVEELIAKVQEKGAPDTLKRKALEIIGAIREWLRSVGFGHLMKYTDADLMRLVQRARDTVVYGKPGSAGKGNSPAVLMRATRAPSAAETITVDGVERPTTNSNGNPIAQTEEGLRNFWRWFGNSRVVDEQGRPLVVYHGTTAKNITEFRPAGGVDGDWQKALDHFKKAQGNNERYGYMNFRSGSFFSPKPDYAGNYTGENTGVMYPVYISSTNPVYFDQKNGGATGVDPNKTPDSLILHENGDINEVAVINPTQIKSATGNRGAFDGTNPDIRYNAADGYGFVSEFLSELAAEDAAFRYPVSKSKTIEGNIADAMPGAEYLGEDTRPDEKAESMADRRFAFKTPGDKTFYVFTRGDDEVWIDVSRLEPGDQGSAVYHGVANYAYNTGKVFIGDPNGLSEDAIIRRTSAMLSSALRFGTTRHIAAADEQMAGAKKNGIPPLSWKDGDDVANLKALIDTYLSTLQSKYPGIKNARYDFGTGQFIGANDLPIRRGDGPGSFDAAAASGPGRASRAGEASLRRGILIQSLASSESSERPGLLELVLSRSSQLVGEQGGLGRVFSQATGGKTSTADQAIYAMAEEGRSVGEILDYIAASSSSPFNRALAGLLKTAGVKTKITVGGSSGWALNSGEGGKFSAGYNPASDTAALFRSQAAERNILHELVHAATLTALERNGLASSKMKALFAHVKRSGKLDGTYGMTSIDEFAAEVFTNPKFQELLKTIEAAPINGKKARSAWDWFVGIVRGILGMEAGQDNALSQALEIGVAVMEENTAMRDGKVAFTEITGKEIDAMPGNTLQSKATNWLRQNLQGKTVVNDSTGWEISTGRKGINKAMSHSGTESVARSVAAIPDLLKNAVLVQTEQNNNASERDDVPWVHHFYAPVRIGGADYVARIVVKEAKDGTRFYDYDTSNEISPADPDSTLPFSQRRGAEPGARPAMSMSELLSYVKEEHGGKDSRFTPVKPIGNVRSMQSDQSATDQDFDADRAWRDLVSRNKFADFDTEAEFVATRDDDAAISTGAISTPRQFTLSKQDGKQWVALRVEETTLDDGSKAFSSSLEASADYPKGTGIATKMYVAALNVAQKNGYGWISEGIRSDESLAIYRRLRGAGVPFSEVGGASFISADDLASVDLQAVADGLAAGRVRHSVANASIRRGTAEEAQANGFTMRAYRGVSAASPFNDSGTVWLTTSRSAAESYATEVFGYEDPEVIEVWVKPDQIPVWDMRKVSDEELETLNPDEFGNPQNIGIYRNSDDSMLGGSGAGTVIHAPVESIFVIDDEAAGRIRYNVADDGWSVAEPSKMDNFIYTLQDKQIDLKRVIDAIKATGKKIADQFNPYLQEELFYGRSAKGVKDFLDFELRPLLKEMQARNVDMGDFEEYLWNRHAEERNIQIAKINKDMPDGGSGIMTEDARDYLAGLDPERRATLEELAEKIDAINKANQRVLVESGLETQETIDAWNGAYKHYVPLQREDVDTGHVGTGKGYSIRGSSSKRAMGSGRQVVDIIANLTMQRERNIVRAEKNRISNALMGLALQNPNDDFWQVDTAPKERTVQEKAIYYVVDSNGERTGEEFTRIDDADRAARAIGGSIEQTFEDRVVERVVPGFQSRDNVILTRVNGQDHYIIFNERNERALRMAMSLKNLDTDTMGRALSVVGRGTRYLASVNTQFNPVFGVVNLVRDVQGSMINLQSTPLAGQQKRVFGYTISAIRGIYADLRAHRRGEKPSSQWADLFEEFQKEGAQTGYRDQFANAEARAEAIHSEFKQFKEGKPIKFGRAIFQWLSDYNDTMENAVRLAAYKVAKENGMNNQQAASLAKNINVNFNRKGQATTQIGALYAFFNASVQGTARIAETLFEKNNGDFKKIRLSKLGKKVVAGGILLGVMQALLLEAAGYDDDEPPEFVRERSLVFPIGNGKYLSLPMPLGFHAIPGLGRIATEFILSGGKDPAKRVTDMLGMFVEAFNPVGSSGISIQSLTPSVIDPLAALAENRDFTGREIYRESFNANDPSPGHARAKDVATPWARFISEGINWATGGTEFKPGAFSPSPDAIDYLVAQVTGGVGREANKVFQTAGATMTGDDLPLYKVPLVGRFVGDTEGLSGNSQKFYNAVREINLHEREVKGLREAGRNAEAHQYVAENPAYRLAKLANATETQVRKLRDQRRKASEAGDSAKVMEINDRISAILVRFNERAAPLLE